MQKSRQSTRPSSSLAKGVRAAGKGRLEESPAAGSEKLVSVLVPSAVVKDVKALLRQYRLGRKVTLVSADQDVTTAKAARILNVSRPHVVKLLDSRKIPSHRVGTHRRVKLKDVLAYKKRQHAANDAVLENLASFAQEHGLGW